MIESLHRAVELVLTGDPEVYFIAWLSLRLSLSSVLIASLIGLPLGFVLGLRPFRARKLIVAALNTLMALPTVVVGLFVYVLISRSGPLGFMGLLFSPEAVIVGQTILCLPIIVSLVYSALSRTDRRLPETLVTLGASPSQLFWMVLREARVAILSALLAGFGRLIGEVGVSMMLGGNIRWYTRTLTTAIALETSKGESEQALALGVILLLIALAVNFLLHGMVSHDG
jgi:tungstate transport system permease protein